MPLASRFIHLAQQILPSPFSIAILLTFGTMLLALLLTEPVNESSSHFFQILGFWEKGFWELLAFTMQMMLILVLGHIVALSKPISKGMDAVLKLCDTSAKAALITGLLTMLFAYFNWGLGLIFGAIFARKVGEYCRQHQIPVNYPLIGAAGYLGLMVWHGGFSGSAPITVSTAGHFLVEKTGVIPVSATLLSPINIFSAVLVLSVLPALLYILEKKSAPTPKLLPLIKEENKEVDVVEGAERLDHSKVFAIIVGIAMLAAALIKAWNAGGLLNALSLNYINFLLFASGILLHGSFHQFTKAATEAIQGSLGIMIQFPLYAGIMGIMKYSGLIAVFSDFFVRYSNEFTFPFFTFISAGLVNVFVPSGGGQWAVQGPIIVDAALKLGIPLNKCIMALAYGDQLTNMLQPFWALPLLGITGLKAKDILPYTFLFFLCGLLIFSVALALF